MILLFQNQMILQDRKEREKGVAKNAVESYVYEMRGKLYSELGTFITEEVHLLCLCDLLVASAYQY